MMIAFLTNLQNSRQLEACSRVEAAESWRHARVRFLVSQPHEEQAYREMQQNTEQMQ
jgi:hypothetical protein